MDIFNFERCPRWEELTQGYGTKQLVILEAFLVNGLSIREGIMRKRGGPKPELYINDIKISPKSVAEYLNLKDSRPVRTMMKEILSKPEMKFLFEYLRSTPTTSGIAAYSSSSSATVVAIRAKDPMLKGIISAVTAIFDKFGVPIRDLHVDDPRLHPRPALVITTHGKIPDGLIDKIRDLEGLSITVGNRRAEYQEHKH